MVEKLKIDDHGDGDAKQISMSKKFLDASTKPKSPEALIQMPRQSIPTEPVLRHGVKGEKFNAITNSMFLKSIKETFGMFEYDIRFEPQIDSMQFRKTYVRKMVDEIGTILSTIE